jgi:hypothetical protein
MGGERTGKCEDSRVEGGRTTGYMRLAVGIVLGFVTWRGKIVLLCITE